MKPVLRILLFTICITTIECGVLELMSYKEIKKEANAAAAVFLQREAGEKIIAFKADAVQHRSFDKQIKFMFKENKKRNTHFDGRTSW